MLSSIFKKPQKDSPNTQTQFTIAPTTVTSLRGAMEQSPGQQSGPLKSMSDASGIPKQAAPAQTPQKGGDLVIEESFSSIVDELAMQFANGADDQVQSMLIAHLNETKGNTDKRIWFMVLDLYQVLGDKTRYEKMAELFARRFSCSPPSWTEAKRKVGNRSASGRNVLILDGGVTASSATKFKDIVAVCKEQRVCKIDCSRMKLEATDAEGMKGLQTTMAQLRKMKVEGLLMGDGHITEALKKKVDAAKTDPKETDIPPWLLLLELLQWQGKAELFEDYAIEYAVAYGESAPGWEDGGVMKSSPAPTKAEPETSINANGIIDPPETISEGNIGELQTCIENVLKSGKDATIDFSEVRRMDFNGAGVFSSFVLTGLPPGDKSIIIKEPNEFVLATMDMMGITTGVKVIQRKR